MEGKDIQLCNLSHGPEKEILETSLV